MASEAEPFAAEYIEILSFKACGIMRRQRIPILLICATMLLTVGAVFVRRSQQPLDSKTIPAEMALRHAGSMSELVERGIEASAKTNKMVEGVDLEQITPEMKAQLDEANQILREADDAVKKLEREQKEEASAWRRAEAASERTRGLVTLALGAVVVMMTVLEVRRRRTAQST